jgi:hypothetical protein
MKNEKQKFQTVALTGRPMIDFMMSRFNWTEKEALDHIAQQKNLNKMKNEKILEMASDLHPDDFAAVMSEMIFLALGDKTPEEGLISHDIIIDELAGVHDRADLVRTYCQEALNVSYYEWAPIYKAMGFAAREEFNKGRVTFGKSDMLAMLASAVMDINAPMTGRARRGANDRPLPTNAAAVAYLESL